MKVQANLPFLKQIHRACFFLYSSSMYFWTINVIWGWHISCFYFSSDTPLFAFWSKEKKIHENKSFLKKFNILHWTSFIHVMISSVITSIIYPSFTKSWSLKEMTNFFFTYFLSGDISLNPGAVYNNSH